MRLYFTCFSLLLVQLLHAQAPAVEWAKCYGGTAIDRAYSSIQTSDGGYLICGFTNSTDGDVTFNHGNSDAWLVKTDPAGGILWQKTYGGSGVDIFRSVVVSGSGYVVCGETASDDGDVTFNHGMTDFWVCGIGITGNLIWEKTYGGSSDDIAYDISVSDSGYFVIGQTFSSDGDVSSYKDNGDAWLISIDQSGVLLDNKAKGGHEEDAYTTIIPVLSGGFLLGGYTYSNDGNVDSLNHGGSDAWLVKVGKTGNFQWTQCYGDTSDDGITELTENSNGNYVISGWITNGTNQNAWNFTTDLNGVLVSGFDFGGSDIEYGGPMFKNTVNRYIIAPSTASPVSGDLNCHIGGDDIWVVEAEVDGTLNWQLCLGGTLNDRSAASLLTADTSYLITGYTNSTDEYVTGNHGNYDWWVVKLLPTCATYASFSYTVDGNIVTFDNNSESATDWQWSFGDGLISNQKHPVHEYAATGAYEVCLISQASSCLPDTFCTTIYICGSPAVASFTYAANNGIVNFSNTSINASQWNWIFGDGNSSTDENPSHTYLMNGNYTVCLTAIDEGCSENTYCETLTICVGETVSQFEYSDAGGTVTFTTTSPTSDTWYWTFGDGGTSTEKNPQHAYTESGTYEVCLIISDACGTDTSCQTIDICVLPVAGYSYFTTDPFTFNFIDESLYTDEWLWIFGDGNTDATSNPTHTYDYGGTFEVCLIAKNECGSDTSCVEIEIGCPAFESGFAFTQSIDTAFFSDQSSATANSWDWFFNDGTYSTQQNPVHVFPGDGVYNVCMMVTDGCTLDTVCHKVTVVGVYTNEPQSATDWNVFPNPLYQFAIIAFNLAEPSDVMISLFNVDGRKISTITNQYYGAGKHEIDFARNQLAAGVYLIQLKRKDGVEFRKLVIEN
ncbi:MAG: PKD domain-containing protein [Chitinophagales bacterium]